MLGTWKGISGGEILVCGIISIIVCKIEEVFVYSKNFIESGIKCMLKKNWTDRTKIDNKNRVGNRSSDSGHGRPNIVELKIHTAKQSGNGYLI